MSNVQDFNENNDSTQEIPAPESEIASEAEPPKKASFFSGTFYDFKPRAVSPTRKMAMKLAHWGVAPVRCCGIVEHPDGGFECTHDAYARKKAKQYGKAEYDKCQSPGKRPYGTKWQKYLTTDLTILHDEWKGWKGESNVGFATGSATGIAIIDFDGETGFANLAALAEMGYIFPKTVTSITGSGGLHLIYRIPQGATIHNSQSRFGDKLLGKESTKIDVRGEGGQALAPSSLHKSGNRYQFMLGCSIDDFAFKDVPELPAWAVQACADAKASQDAANKKTGSTKAKGEKVAKGTSADAFIDAGAALDNAGGLDNYLSMIGDHDGGAGFDGPIYKAALSYFATNGVDATSDEIHSILKATILAAECSNDRAVSRYATDDYLAGRIEQARAFVVDAGEKERERIKSEIDRIKEKVDAFDEWTRKSAIDRVLNELAALDAPPAQRKAILGKLAKPAAMTVPNLEKAVSNLAKQRKAKAEEEEKEAERLATNEAVIDGEDQPPILRVMQDHTDYMVRVAWARLGVVNKLAQRYFEIGGKKVRLVDSPSDGAIKPEQFTRDAMLTELTQHVRWMDMLHGEPRNVAADTNVVTLVLNQTDLHFPPLKAIVNSPYFTADGELISSRGYQTGAQVFYDPPAGFELPPIPEHPSLADVKMARELIEDHVLVDFPFSDGEEGTGKASKAHAVALLLQQFMRPMIPGDMPIIFVQKPEAATGASLLVQSLMYIALGRKIGAQTEKATPDEFRKALTAFLLTGGPVLFVDNINAHVHGAALANFVTCGVWEDRPLNVSEIIRSQVTCSTILAGNNVVMSSEIARRCAPILLDAARDPKERSSFRHDLKVWVPEHRAELVAACLILIRYWIDQGQPKGIGKPLPSFEGWSRVMGGLLETIGVEGFLGNLDLTREASSADEEPWGEFCAHWYDEFGDKPRLVGTPYDGGNAGPYDGEKSLVSLIEKHGLEIKISGDTPSAQRSSLGSRMARRKGVQKFEGRAFRIKNTGRGGANKQMWLVELVVVDPFMQAAEVALGNMTEDEWQESLTEADF